MKKVILISMASVILLSSCGMKDAPQNSEEVQKKQPKTTEVAEKEKEDELTLAAAFFNEIEEVNGERIITNPDNIAVKVNQEARLPDEYRPDDLVEANVPFMYETTDERNMLREEAAKALEQLFAAAEEEGYQLYAVSGFRPFSRQKMLYNQAVENQGKDQELVAMPGHSEHQTGLAMDVATDALTEEFGLTSEGIWVAENAHQYGFVIRYPKGKEEITGYQYEPWHLRYVGKKVAADLVAYDYTLEEYFENVKKM
ncbi:M15 family metallopeptidase [Bacillus sp. FSL W7-1360]